MIIHRILASNVLKYARLELDDLPQQGLIAITGPNESGKSTIGETLCFALFGRTFSLDHDDLGKIIHWGETHCSVEVDFTASDGQRYNQERFLDDSGNHSARLIRADAAAGEEPLARGVEQVADQVYSLVGYEYEEFIESFYLAQREITTPHPHSYAVKTMAGLVTLEYCAGSFQEEAETAQAGIQETDKEMTNLATQIEEVGLEEDRLPGLKAQRDDLSTRMADLKRQHSALDRASVDYQDALPRRESAMQARATAGFFRFISLLLALLTGGAWVLLSQMPEHAFAGSLNDLFNSSVPGWNAATVVWLLYAAIGFGVLFILFWVRRSGQDRLQRELADSGNELASILNGLEPVEALRIQEATADAEKETDASAPAPDSIAEDAPQASAAEDTSSVVARAARERLSQRVAGCQADFTEVREGVGNELNLLQDAINQYQEHLGQLDEAVGEEQGRISQVEGLTAMQEDLAQKNTQRQHHIEMCALAGELIQGSMREVSYQFNRKVRGLVSKTLPLFTENRYEHLQIDDDLTVRAFSSEKHDFMDLEEISSGTQRQIMLAVRLALSEELVGRAVKSSQFLFLDEPFAFFDQARTRNSLKVLPTLSEKLTQIWIIGQEFPEGSEFARHIRCDRGFQTVPPDTGALASGS